jgi:bifunctional DNA-binding transcriptional regulator/antitoxin component of YhaV-PrlF toxin-antitoxin module
MATIKLTAKRQATFPAEVCRELGVGIGDALEIKSVRHEDQTVWVLVPVEKKKSNWIGSLQKYAKKAKPWTREEHGAATAQAIGEESGK